MKDFMKNMFGLMVSVPLGGAVISSIGSTFTSGLSGIGSATQSMVSIGIFSNATKLVKWK